MHPFVATSLSCISTSYCSSLTLTHFLHTRYNLHLRSEKISSNPKTLIFSESQHKCILLLNSSLLAFSSRMSCNPHRFQLQRPGRRKASGCSFDLLSSFSLVPDMQASDLVAADPSNNLAVYSHMCDDLCFSAHEKWRSLLGHIENSCPIYTALVRCA